MRHVLTGSVVLILLISAAVFHGCGYTHETLLPAHVKSVHVARVVNEIDIASEVTSESVFKVYRPGLEVELRNALIERFVFDGHLKIRDMEEADAVLQVRLKDFRRDPLRYNDDESVQEFRVTVVAICDFVDLANEKTLWQTSGISGDSSYFLSGPHARSEDEAVGDALEDLARHAVEDILEAW